VRLASFAVAGLAGFLALLSLAWSEVLQPRWLVPLIPGLLLGGLGERPLVCAGAAAAALGLAGWVVGPPPDLGLAYAMDSALNEQARAHFLAASPLAGPVSWLALALGLALGWLAARCRLRGTGDLLLLGFLGLALVASSLNFDPHRLERFTACPEPQSYQYDGQMYMRVLCLMWEGRDYYSACHQGYLDRREGVVPASVLGWRPPLVPLAWSWLLPPRGIFLVYAFLALMLAQMGAALYVARRCGAGPLAGLAPILLFPYSVYAVVSFHFNFLEYWSTALALGSLAFLLGGGRGPALALGVAAALAREWGLWYWAGLSVDQARQHRGRPGRLAPVFAGWLVLGLYYLYHVARVRAFPEVGGVDPLAYASAGGLPALWACLQYGYLLLPLRPVMPLLVAFLGFTGIALRLRAPGGLALAVSALPTFLFLGFSHSVEVQGRTVFLPDYWGAVVTPWLMALAPVALARLGGAASGLGADGPGPGGPKAGQPGGPPEAGDGPAPGPADGPRELREPRGTLFNRWDGFLANPGQSGRPGGKFRASAST
jgi:hypothetical protein